MVRSKDAGNHGLEEGLSVKERRHFIRHPLCFPLSYKVMEKRLGLEVERKGTTSINISIGGLLFAAKHPVDKGTSIVVKLPFQDKVFNIKAHVVHCDQNIETKLFNIGVKFFKLNDAFKVKLIEQIYLISEFRDLWSIQLGREVTLEEASKQWIKRYSKRFSRLYW